ncbi:MAG: lipopolysaccharide kinase InaA family protein [Candidatus Brocadiales bacterium]
MDNIFAVYKEKGVKIYYRKEYKLADILNLLKKVTNCPENAQRHVLRLKRSSKAIVFLEEIPFNGVPKKVVVKRISYRSVFFFDLRGIRFMLRKTFLGARGRRAWVAGNGLIARGIPTPQPIALIEKKFLGFTRDNILLTEYIDNTLSVDDHVSKYFNNGLNLGVMKKKRLFIEELARFVRVFHNTGIYHGDLSGRNILVKEEQRGNWEMFIIDLDAVSLWKKLTLRRRLQDLARINVCPNCITNTDRMRFFKAYFHGRPPKAHEYVRRIFELAGVIGRRRFRRRRRKSNCLNVFAVYKAKGVKIYYRKEYKLTDILDLLKRVTNYPENVQRHGIVTTTPHTPPSPPSEGGDNGEVKHVLKRSSKAEVLLEEIPFNGAPKKVVVKHIFCRRNFFDMLKKTLLGTKGKRAWVAGNGLLAKGIATPQPIALIEKKSFGLTGEDFLLTRYINGTLSVNDYVSKYFSRDAMLCVSTPLVKGARGIKDKRVFIEELARFVRSFHDTGFYHCDLSGVNILVKEGRQGKRKMFIIDLNSVSLWKKLTLKRRLKNLSQINGRLNGITNTDRMRFFKTYFRGIPFKAHEYIRGIAKHRETRRLRKASKGG